MCGLFTQELNGSRSINWLQLNQLNDLTLFIDLSCVKLDKCYSCVAVTAMVIIVQFDLIEIRNSFVGHQHVIVTIKS